MSLCGSSLRRPVRPTLGSDGARVSPRGQARRLSDSGKEQSRSDRTLPAVLLLLVLLLFLASRTQKLLPLRLLFVRYSHPGGALALRGQGGSEVSTVKSFRDLDRLHSSVMTLVCPWPPRHPALFGSFTLYRCTFLSPTCLLCQPYVPFKLLQRRSKKTSLCLPLLLAFCNKKTKKKTRRDKGGQRKRS